MSDGRTHNALKCSQQRLLLLTPSSRGEGFHNIYLAEGSRGCTPDVRSGVPMGVIGIT